MWRLSLVGLSLIFGFAYTDDKLQCKDEDGNSVDWFVMYKINNQSTATEPLINNGEAYVYITSNTVTTGWTLTTKGVDSQTAMLSHTLSPVYKTGGTDHVSVMYNDQNPVYIEKLRLGYTKGVLMANENEGLWLVHSVPQFPPTRSKKYSFPPSGKVFGQSFLCISVKSDQIEKIAKQLYFNQVIAYDVSSTQKLLDKYPALVKVIEGEVIIGQPSSNKENIYSAGGVEFISFAKTDYWDKDLYHDYVAPELRKPLHVRTWLSEVRNLDSNCTGYAVSNIQQIRIPGADEPIRRSQDHSKWAISAFEDGDELNNHWVCVGDINRADFQRIRGGGTVCVRLPELWDSYNSLIDKMEPCLVT